MKKYLTVMLRVMLIPMLLAFVACTSDDEPRVALSEPVNVTFTFTFDESVLSYYEIRAVYNNESLTDVAETAVLKSPFVYRCRVDRLPAAVPLQFLHTRTNRPVPADERITFCLDVDVAGKVCDHRSTGVVTVATEGARYDEHDPVLADLLNRFHNFGVKFYDDAAYKIFNVQ